MQVSEVMHQEPICVDINDSLNKVARIMREEDVDVVSVLDGQRIVGIVTEKDISTAVDGPAAPENVPIAHVMSEDVITIAKESSLERAREKMLNNQLTQLIVTEGDLVIGTVNQASVNEALATNN
jgi:CBS domain-containing protein